MSVFPKGPENTWVYTLGTRYSLGFGQTRGEISMKGLGMVWKWPGVLKELSLGQSLEALPLAWTHLLVPSLQSTDSQTVLLKYPSH